MSERRWQRLCKRVFRNCQDPLRQPQPSLCAFASSIYVCSSQCTCLIAALLRVQYEAFLSAMYFLREGLDLVSILRLSFDTTFSGVNTQRQEWGRLTLRRNIKGKRLLLSLAGGSQCRSVPRLQFCLGNRKENYSSCSETTNINLDCRFSFMLGGQH